MKTSWILKQTYKCFTRILQIILGVCGVGAVSTREFVINPVHSMLVHVRAD
jgi:hypothetical protein